MDMNFEIFRFKMSSDLRPHSTFLFGCIFIFFKDLFVFPKLIGFHSKVLLWIHLGFLNLDVKCLSCNWFLSTKNWNNRIIITEFYWWFMMEKEGLILMLRGHEEKKYQLDWGMKISRVYLCSKAKSKLHATLIWGKHWIRFPCIPACWHHKEKRLLCINVILSILFMTQFYVTGHRTFWN